MYPSAYPERPTRIELVQTHISSVFIGDKYVYKIKKPVNFGFLDFSTLEKRLYYCKQEVELNNRFSEGVYLGVYPVNFNGKRHLIDGDGKIVDYAVKMKRLKDEDLMKNRFKKDDFNTKDVKKIAKAIANFHKNSKQSYKISQYGKIESIKVNTDENFEQTEKFIGSSITKGQFIKLRSWTNEFYKKNKDIFLQRVKKGKIRDCHGDLHMEHVCLSDPIIIFDCIEFNERFRYIDTLSDISFLIMDLDYNEGEYLSNVLLESYLKYSDEDDDEIVLPLIRFYKVYRAYVRGKVNSLMLNDGKITDYKKNEAKKNAKEYFNLAFSYISK